MTRLLLLAGVRYHLRHRWQLALALLGISLGVAVVVAVDVATSSARRSFTVSTEAVTGRATHEITGGPAGLPDSAYALVRLAAGVDSAAPVVDRYVRLPDHGGRTLRLLGVDPFAEAPFRTYVPRASGTVDMGMLLGRRSVLLESGTAAELGVRTGDRLRVAAGTIMSDVVIAGTLEPHDDLARRALADVMLADIATAQEVTGTTGRIDRIELRLPGKGAAALAAVTAALPRDAGISDTAARTRATAGLTDAFETNLTALSLVALVFGMFLIYNSVTFSVLQRRPLIGLLRAQGVTGRELFALFIAEAVLLGVLATVLGVALGVMLGGRLVQLVAGTINDLYYTVSVSALQLEPLTFVKAALLGIGATAGAAFIPAREAVRARPRAALARSTLERGARRNATRLGAFGLLAAALTVLILLLPSRSIVLGFAALFVLIVAAALLTPLATVAIMGVLSIGAGRGGLVGVMATRGVTASLSRTAPAIAALSVALAVGIAVTIMIGSFRAGVVEWLGRSLQADIYISVPGGGPDRQDAPLPPDIGGAVAALPHVAGVTTYRHATMLVADDFIRVMAVDLHPAHRAAFEILDAQDDTWRAFAGGAVLVSEPLAYRQRISAGDSITLPTARGASTFRVAAVYRDYASEHGVLFIDRTVYDRLWDDDAVTSLGVFVDPGSEAEVMQRITALPAAAGLVLRPNRALRDATLQVFDRTFAITGVLRLLALLVAFVGVTGALMALQLERARESGVLRAIGLTPAQVWALTSSQSALIGVTAAVLAVPLGLAMAWAMVHVINRRSFGWSFDMVVGLQPFAHAFVIGTAAAVLAGIYPAWRMSRALPAAAMRAE